MKMDLRNIKKMSNDSYRIRIAKGRDESGRIVTVTKIFHGTLEEAQKEYKKMLNEILHDLSLKAANKENGGVR